MSKEATKGERGYFNREEDDGFTVYTLDVDAVVVVEAGRVHSADAALAAARRCWIARPRWLKMLKSERSACAISNVLRTLHPDSK